MFNRYAESVLDSYVAAPYRLNAEGARAIVAANERLGAQYFDHLEFPVSDFWGKYFMDKVNLLPPRAHGVMLDVCCGTGTLCLNVMRRGAFERCVALDNSATALQRLSERIREHGLANIEVVKGDIMRTEFADASFDAVLGNSFLHHLPDNPAFLREMYRILKPGGTICFTGEPTVAADVLENAIMGSLVAVWRWVRGRKRPPVSAQQITDIWIYEKRAVRAMLEACGYSDIRIHPFGVLVPLFNAPTAYARSLLGLKSMQPDGYWKYLGAIDRVLSHCLPANAQSHFVIAARKP